MTPKQFQDESRQAALEALDEIRRRIADPAPNIPGPRQLTPGFGELLEAYEKLATRGGILPADAAWSAAMRALASEHLTPDQRDRILRVLSGESLAPAAGQIED